MTANKPSPVHTGTIIEDDCLSLAQLCQAAGTHADWIISLVEESIIETSGDNQFSGTCLVRVRSALRLHRDLGINLAGIALAFELREQLDTAHAALNRLGYKA
ncbi:MAG: MerR family transcriptional regulator [Methylococcales bacterium]|nr:MerR family transcriptional regulator [Methylococcales bacterium]